VVTIHIQDDQIAFRAEEREDDQPVTEMGNGEAPPLLESVLS